MNQVAAQTAGQGNSPGASRRIEGGGTLARTERHLWVDYAKGIGIVLVVYGHVMRGLFAAHLPMDEGAVHLVDSIIYSFHMPLFFFLAGLFFLGSLEKSGPAGLMAKKVDTVFYPYVVWSLAQGGIEVLMSRWTNKETSIAEVLSLLWTPRAQFWFLFVLFLYFLLATLVFGARRMRGWTLPVLGLSAIVFLFHHSLELQVARQFMTNLVFFMSGLVFWQYREALGRLLGSPLAMPASLLAFAGAQFAVHRFGAPMPEIPTLQFLPLACVSIVFVIALCMWLSRFRLPTLRFLGQMSMEIYLAHILVASGLRIVLTKLLHVDNVAEHAFIGTVGAIAIPIALALIVRRIPHGAALYENPVKTQTRRLSSGATCG